MSKESLPKIAIVHPDFRFGGGEAVTLWTIEALKNLFNVYLITTSKIDLSTLNTFYGTNLKKSDFSIVNLPIPNFLSSVDKFFLLKQHLTMRYCKEHAIDFDIFFSTFNEMDFGKKGIQYINFPVLDDSIARTMQFMNNSFFYKDTFLRKIYIGLCKKLSHFSIDSLRQNITLTSSNWGARVVQSLYGITSKTIYPPVTSNFPLVSWKDREDGFVCIGRISPEKKIKNIINILQKVREKGFNTHLHVIGRFQNATYALQILRLIKENSTWITLNEGLPKEEVSKILTGYKYGIHGMPREHFGIGIVEMIKAGNIVFVPNDGGQVEIVGNNPNLVYENELDATEKIIKVVSSTDLQQTLLEFLSACASKFSVERFMSEIREVVLNALK
jgi:glycosyltransferase involved in cell wall biosynthesis